MKSLIAWDRHSSTYSVGSFFHKIMDPGHQRPVWKCFRPFLSHVIVFSIAFKLLLNCLDLCNGDEVHQALKFHDGMYESPRGTQLLVLLEWAYFHK